jgi:hypothetical protein
MTGMSRSDEESLSDNGNYRLHAGSSWEQQASRRKMNALDLFGTAAALQKA